MEYELRTIVEKVSVSSQEVVRRDPIKIYDVERLVVGYVLPRSIRYLARTFIQT